jgi:hypothetical protein
MLGLPPLSPAAAAAPATAAPAVHAAHVAPAASAATPSVVAAASACGGKRKGRGSGAALRARKQLAAEVEAAARAFQNKGPSAKSENSYVSN